MSRQAFAVPIMAMVSAMATCPAVATDWPQFQQNAAHTGWTPDSPLPPYGVEWSVSFYPETLGVVQPIVYQDVLYAPTLQGNLYALDPRTGQRRWVQKELGVVTRSAAAAGGLVYVANLEGKVLAVKADGSGIAWTADLGFGISAFPCVADGKIYIGTRRGELFCLDGASGTVIWKTPLEGYVWSGAAVADGKLYLATDRAIRLHCLDAARGTVLWKSDRLPGVLVREWCPVVTGGKVFLHTMPPEYDYVVPRPFQTWLEKADLFGKYQAELRAGKMPKDFEVAMDEFLAALKEKPARQTLFAFDAATGKVPYLCTHMQVGSLWFGCPPPPAVDATGLLQVRVPYCFSRFARMSPDTGRYVDILVGDTAPAGKSGPPDRIGTNSDEAHGASCGGDWVFWLHFGPGNCDSSLAFNVRTREFAHLPGSAAAPPSKYPAGQAFQRAKRQFVSIFYDPKDKYHALAEDPNWTLKDQTEESGSSAAAIWNDLVLKYSTKGGSQLFALRGMGSATPSK